MGDIKYKTFFKHPKYFHKSYQILTSSWSSAYTSHANLRPTAPVMVQVGAVSRPVYALLDSRTTHSTISVDLAKELGLTPDSNPSSYGPTKTTDPKSPPFTVTNLDKTLTLHVETALITPSIGMKFDNPPKEDMNERYPYMKDVRFECLDDHSIHLILGAKHAHSWSPKETRTGRLTQPIAVRSALGWYLIGKDRENENKDTEGHVSDSKDQTDSEDHCHFERDGTVDRVRIRSSNNGTTDWISTSETPSNAPFETPPLHIPELNELNGLKNSNELNDLTNPPRSGGQDLDLKESNELKERNELKELNELKERNEPTNLTTHLNTGGQGLELKELKELNEMNECTEPKGTNGPTTHLETGDEGPEGTKTLGMKPYPANSAGDNETYLTRAVSEPTSCPVNVTGDSNTVINFREALVGAACTIDTEMNRMIERSGGTTDLVVKTTDTVEKETQSEIQINLQEVNAYEFRRQ